MKPWQKPLIAAVVGAAVAIRLVTWLMVSLATGPSAAATKFVLEIAHAGPRAAYQDAAPILRLAESEGTFEAEVRRWRLAEAVSARWPNVRGAGDGMTATGEAILKSGERIPLRIDMVRAGKAWTVSRLRLDAGVPDGDR